MSRKSAKKPTNEKRTGPDSQVKDYVQMLKKENKKRQDAFQDIFDHIDALFDKADAADKAIKK